MLENDSTKSFVSEDEEKNFTPEKLAAKHLRIALSIFRYLHDEFIEKIPARQEVRPVESYSAACQGMMDLCRTHIHEVLIRTAIHKSSKSGLIAELCVGANSKYQQVALTFGELNRHFDHVAESFKLYLKIKGQYYSALSLFYHGKSCADALYDSGQIVCFSLIICSGNTERPLHFSGLPPRSFPRSNFQTQYTIIR